MKRNDGESNRKLLRAALAIGVIAVVAGGLWFGLRPVGTGESADDAPPGTSSSGAAPAFQLPRLTGKRPLSTRDLDGSPYVLNFWATWCDPCRKEMPAFERVWQKYKSRGVVIVGVNINDDLGDAREFAGELGITYPLVVDENDELATELGVKGLPQTFFVDTSGDIVDSGAELGLLTQAELTKTIDRILEGAGSS
jgi:cytochrome c biogenesis protein CcmG, thiol:disulfide interchange protein DsbE